MSACLHRAPWKRNAGSYWTAKGASSAEVRPPFVCRLFLYRRPWTHDDSTRHDKTASCRQTNRRNTPLLSAVSTLEQRRTHCRARFNALFLLKRIVTHTLVTPRIFFLFYILLEEIKMSQSLDQNDTGETHPDPLTCSVTAKLFLWKADLETTFTHASSTCFQINSITM